jgi:hypothetical protein
MNKNNKVKRIWEKERERRGGGEKERGREEKLFCIIMIVRSVSVKNK